MANIFELNINLNTVSKSEAKKALDRTTKGESEDQQPKEEEKSFDSLSASVKALKGNYFFSEAVSDVANPLIGLGMASMATYGDQARLNKISNFADGAGRVTGLASNVVTGAAAGGWVGAIVAGVLDIVGTTISYFSNITQYNNKQLDYKYNSNYQQERLGLIAESKGR